MWFPTIFPLGSWCAWVTEGGQCTRNLTVSGAEMFCYVSLTPRGSTLLCGRHKGKKMVKNSVSRGCTAMYWYETYSLCTAIHWVNVLLPTLESSSMLVLENITSTARKKKKKKTNWGELGVTSWIRIQTVVSSESTRGGMCLVSKGSSTNQESGLVWESSVSAPFHRSLGGTSLPRTVTYETKTSD